MHQGHEVGVTEGGSAYQSDTYSSITYAYPLLLYVSDKQTCLSSLEYSWCVSAPNLKCVQSSDAFGCKALTSTKLLPGSCGKC